MLFHPVSVSFQQCLFLNVLFPNFVFQKATTSIITYIYCYHYYYFHNDTFLNDALICPSWKTGQRHLCDSLYIYSDQGNSHITGSIRSDRQKLGGEAKWSSGWKGEFWFKTDFREITYIVTCNKLYFTVSNLLSIEARARLLFPCMSTICVRKTTAMQTTGVHVCCSPCPVHPFAN